jgi:hypothetical protein
VIDLRLRTKISAAELDQKKGKILTDKDYNLLLTGPARIRKPDGKLLCVYLPGAVREQFDEAWEVLHKIRMQSDNRGLASGTKRVNAGGNRTRAMPVKSGIMGAMDPAPNRDYCRLTHFTREHTDKWEATHPLLQSISELFSQHVPDRFAVQKGIADNTHPDWVVPGTPFTTITINNSYATGVHTDSGDLDEGFSCLAVGRGGDFRGGILTFPEYRVAADMQHGDLILMDAHEWHGNTGIFCKSCGEMLRTGPCECDTQRVSVVCYYRTKMKACSSMNDENAKRQAWAEKRTASKEEAVV